MIITIITIITIIISIISIDLKLKSWRKRKSPNFKWSADRGASFKFDDLLIRADFQTKIWQTKIYNKSKLNKKMLLLVVLLLEFTWPRRGGEVQRRLWGSLRASVQ